jgi:hypothetical protein
MIPDEEYQLYPVEILAVMRLRKRSGLDVVEVDHDLMKLPSARLYEPVAAVYPDLVGEMIVKLREEVPALADGL